MSSALPSVHPLGARGHSISDVEAAPASSAAAAAALSPTAAATAAKVNGLTMNLLASSDIHRFPCEVTWQGTAYRCVLNLPLEKAEQVNGAINDHLKENVQIFLDALAKQSAICAATKDKRFTISLDPNHCQVQVDNASQDATNMKSDVDNFLAFLRRHVLVNGIPKLEVNQSGKFSRQAPEQDSTEDLSAADTRKAPSDERRAERAARRAKMQQRKEQAVLNAQMRPRKIPESPDSSGNLVVEVIATSDAAETGSTSESDSSF